MIGAWFLPPFNILGKSGYETLPDNGVFVQLRKDGIYLTSGVHEKYRGYGVLLELAKKMS